MKRKPLGRKLLGWLGAWIAPRREVERDYLRFVLAALVWIALAAMVFDLHHHCNRCIVRRSLVVERAG